MEVRLYTFQKTGEQNFYPFLCPWTSKERGVGEGRATFLIFSFRVQLLVIVYSLEILR